MKEVTNGPVNEPHALGSQTQPLETRQLGSIKRTLYLYGVCSLTQQQLSTAQPVTHSPSGRVRGRTRNRTELVH